MIGSVIRTVSRTVETGVAVAVPLGIELLDGVCRLDPRTGPNVVEALSRSVDMKRAGAEIHCSCRRCSR